MIVVCGVFENYDYFLITDLYWEMIVELVLGICIIWVVVLRFY